MVRLVEQWEASVGQTLFVEKTQVIKFSKKINPKQLYFFIKIEFLMKFINLNT